MKKLLLTAFAIITVTGIAGAGTAFYFAKQDEPSKPSTPTKHTTRPESSQDITFSADKKTVSYKGVPGETALTSLKTLTDITTETTSYGEMVTGINDIKAQPMKEFWAFYINGKQASEGAGTYKAVAGDKIEWKLEALL